MLTFKRDERYLMFENTYWRVVHDLKRGGAISELYFLKGKQENFLAQPIGVYSGKFSILNETSPNISIRRDGSEFIVTVRGRLISSNGEKGSIYRITYHYNDAYIRVNHAIDDVQNKITSWSVTFSKNCSWVEVGNPFFGTQLDKHWYKVSELKTPLTITDVLSSWGGYSEQGEGLQFLVPNLEPWWKNNSHFTADDRGGKVTLEVTYKTHGSVTWETILAPTNFGRGQAYFYREAVICSQPFPTDNELRQLVNLGVNLVRIHEGANWKNTSEDYWADGMYPPYPGQNLSEMKRVINTCHRLGIKIIPYFSVVEVHPLSPAFLKHGIDWYLKAGPDHYLRWSHPGTDQLWGAVMCTASGWGQWLARYIERVIEEYGFDGIYLDGTGTGLCFHSGHGSVPHSNFDGHQRILERLRKRFPDKLIVLHQPSFGFNLAQLNISDHMVTYEEFGLDELPRLEDLSMPIRLASSCISTAIVPGIFCPRDGTPISPQLYYFSYQQSKEPKPTRNLLKQGIPVFLLNGNIPYSYYFNESLMWGYNNYQDRLRDNDGIYGLYRKIAKLGDISGEFLPWYRCPYRTSASGVKVAAILQSQRTILVIVNLTNKSVSGITLEGPELSKQSKISMSPFEYLFVETQKAL